MNPKEIDNYLNEVLTNWNNEDLHSEEDQNIISTENISKQIKPNYNFKFKDTYILEDTLENFGNALSVILSNPKDWMGNISTIELFESLYPDSKDLETINQIEGLLFGCNDMTAIIGPNRFNNLVDKIKGYKIAKILMKTWWNIIGELDNLNEELLEVAKHDINNPGPAGEVNWGYMYTLPSIDDDLGLTELEENKIISPEEKQQMYDNLGFM